MYNPFPLPPVEIAARAEAIYRERLQEALDTPENLGKFLSIDIESGDYALGDRHMESYGRLKQKRPDAVIYTMRIGYPAAVSMSGRLLPLPK